MHQMYLYWITAPTIRWKVILLAAKTVRATTVKPGNEPSACIEKNINNRRLSQPQHCSDEISAIAVGMAPTASALPETM
jgi:hypothetical protein